MNNETKIENPPAFPFFTHNKDGYGNTLVVALDGEQQYLPFEPGMTLRDYFAAKAMAASLVSNPRFVDPDKMGMYAVQAYTIADAMLKQRMI